MSVILTEDTRFCVECKWHHPRTQSDDSGLCLHPERFEQKFVDPVSGHTNGVFDPSKGDNCWFPRCADANADGKCKLCSVPIQQVWAKNEEGKWVRIREP